MTQRHSTQSRTIANYSALAESPDHELALDCIEAGIEAARPDSVVAESVRVDGDTLHVADATYDLAAYDEVVVLGGGNAAAHVSRALERVLGDHIAGGAVVTDDPVDTERVDVLPGDHPVPSERGVESASRLLDLAETVDEGTLVLAVITGGGSALMAAPADGISLTDLQATTDALLACGASIHEINAVRKHLSALKGGQLARRLAPARVATLVLSDVTGNDLDVIASGPTVPDSSTYDDALAAVEGYDLDVPASVHERLERGAAGDRPETPGADDRAFDTVSTHILADGYTAIQAARDLAERAGYTPVVLSSTVRGEACEAARTHVAIAEEAARSGNPVEPPAVLLSGGETTVTLSGEGGSGGPNQEFALSAAIETAGDATIATVDTDGIDGATDVAGALVDAETVADANEASAALAANDAHTYLDDVGATIETGPTGTNVNDLRVVVVR